MRTLFVLSVLSALLCAAACYRDLEAEYDPYAANLVNQAIAQSDRQNTVLDLSDRLSELSRRVAAQRQVAPPARQSPVLAPLFDDLVKSLGSVRKAINKEKKTPANDPNQMAMYHMLIDGIRKSNKRLDPTPTPLPVSTSQVDALRRLIYQSNAVGGAETPELRNLHDRSHAQSRMLHRLTHAVETMGETMNTAHSNRYDALLGTMLHHHLADRHYRNDPLHDHLLAHHLEAQHSDAEFADHLAHHVLFSNLDKHIETDSDVDTAVGTAITAPLAAREAQQQQINAADIAKNIQQQQQQAAAYKQQLTNTLRQRSNAAAPAAAPVATPAAPTTAAPATH